MEILSYNLPLDWNLFLFGDDHEGAALRNNHGWDQLVDMMQSPYDGLPASRNKGLHHGDILEAIQTDDKRYNIYDTKEPLTLAQIYQSIRNLDPIKGQMLCLLDGNHPQRLHKFGEISKHIAKELDIPYGTWSALLNYNDTKGNFKFGHFATHGTGSISSVADDPERRKTNMRLSLKRKLKNKINFLLGSMGHTHKILISKPSEDLYITDGDNKLEQHYTGAPSIPNGYIHPDFRWYVNTGAFLKLYGDGMSGYAERAGYDPIENGFAICKIRGGMPVDVVKIIV